MLSKKISYPTVRQILEEMPPEQSPVEQVKEVLVRAELLSADSLQNEAVNELLNMKVSEMVAEILEGNKPEQIAVEDAASSMVQATGADMESNVIYLNHNMSIRENQEEPADVKQEVTDLHLDEEAIRQQTEEYVEQMEATNTEEAMLMEG